MSSATRGILVLDFGGQTTQLILKRLRRLGYFCEIDGPNADPEAYRDRAGIIFSGGPASAGEGSSPGFPEAALRAEVPILGICYGMQLLAHASGGRLESQLRREYGIARLEVKQESLLFESVSSSSSVWMSHGDHLEDLPEAFEVLASSPDLEAAAVRHRSRPWYGLQFHPEVTHTREGEKLLDNFASKVCGLEPDWKPGRILEEIRESLETEIPPEAQVLVGLSGGVDSSVTAALLIRCLGSDRVHPVLVDTGFLRLDEAREVEDAFERAFGKKVLVVEAEARFFEALQGISSPEEKRKRIGHTFIEVFEEEARKIPGLTHLGQGTLYPDVIESMPWRGPSAVIKSHHNVGGLPEDLELRLVEPLRMLFKDDVRALGRELGLPEELLARHPFPGPGLAIRILGEPRAERVRVLQRADAIFLEVLRAHGWYDKTWQAFTVLLPVKTVGVMGDQRTYEDVLALRAVNSVDGMTADWTRLPYELLQEASTRIVNEVRGINRVVFDITSKPPGTIEWE